ncbi:MAG TPA: HAD-IA family hydrolase [Thermoanaerobaculia bacterium]
MIRAVFFDAGATLLFSHPPVEQVYAREFAADGCALSAEEFRTALDRAWQIVHAEGAHNRYGGVRGEASFWKSFLNRVRAVLDGGTVSDEAFDRLAAHFRNPSSWVVYDDVVPALDALGGRGLKLGVVSNWDSQLPQLLEALGLADRFGSIVVSAIEEMGKPDREIFLRACSRLDVEPGEALHVGDSLVEDFEGARAAGLQALLLDRKDEHPRVAERIRGLGELTARL